MDIFDFILLPRDRFYGGMVVWYYLPCRIGRGFPLYLASHDSRSVLAVKGPLRLSVEAICGVLFSGFPFKGGV